MELNWIDRVGDWNPQLLREIKGRLNFRNIAIAGGMSLLGQMLLLFVFWNQLPGESSSVTTYNRFCTGNGQQCLIDAAGNFEINWQLWSLDLFLWIGFVSIFALLVGGTYMLIGDLANEERRGTLNFLRLSPQSTVSILTGKLLGVPIVLYAVVLLAVPLHLWAGLTAQIPLGLILSFYVVQIASCAFFYSASLLFGLVSAFLSGFQAFLGSGLVLMYLSITCSKLMPYYYGVVTHTAVDWLNLFSPSFILPYVVFPVSSTLEAAKNYFPYANLEMLRWFNLPVGASAVGAVSLLLLNYAVCSYWVWQALKRRFPNPTSTLLSKGQSYALVACFEVVFLGFAQPIVLNDGYTDGWFKNFIWLLAFNQGLFLTLMAALSPHRQALQDWARYRKVKNTKTKGIFGFLNLPSSWKDLIWGEKSPSVVAIGLNLAIASTMLLPWILIWPTQDNKMSAILAWLLSVNSLLIYASIAQLMLFMKTPKRAVWAIATVAGLMFLPPIICGMLSISTDTMPALWLLSALPWGAVEHAGATTIIMTVLGQWLGFALLNIQTTRQLRLAGESESKAILAGRRSLPAS